MKNFPKFYATIIILIGLSFNSYSQTKKEKKVELKTINIKDKKINKSNTILVKIITTQSPYLHFAKRNRDGR